MSANLELGCIPSSILVSWPLNVSKLSFVGCVVAMDVEWELDYREVRDPNYNIVSVGKLTFQEPVALVPVNIEVELEGRTRSMF